MSDTGSNSPFGDVRRGAIDKSAVVTIVIVAIATTAFVVWMPICNHGPGKPPEWAWYAVEGTQEFVVDKADLIPPIERDGKRLVKAHFYGCDDCEEANRFLGYFEKYSDEAKAELERLIRAGPAGGAIDENTEIHIYDLGMKGRFYSIDGKTWLLAESEEAQMILEKLRDNCGDRRLAYCYPRSEQGWDR